MNLLYYRLTAEIEGHAAKIAVIPNAGRLALLASDGSRRELRIEESADLTGFGDDLDGPAVSLVSDRFQARASRAVVSYLLEK